MTEPQNANDLTQQMIDSSIAAQNNLNTTEPHEYECETCGRKDTLTEKEAFDAGWDYPPFIGIWGVLSPRTCGNCMIDTTAYWAVILASKGGKPVDVETLDERHQATIRRIAMEPASAQIEAMRKGGEE